MRRAHSQGAQRSGNARTAKWRRSKLSGRHSPTSGLARAVAADFAEPLGSQHHAVVFDLELDVATDRLDVDLLKRIPAFTLGFAGRGWRRQLVDQPDQRRRPQRMGFKAQRMDEAQEPVAAFGEFGIGDMRAFGHAKRDDQTATADMEGHMRRTALPDEIVEPRDPFARNRLIDAALFVAGGEPRRDDLPYPRAREIEHLQAGSLGQPFGEELTQDFAGTLISADERRHLEDEALGAGIAVEPGAVIEDPVREPVREHVEGKARARLFRRGGVGEQRAHQRVARAGKRETHGF